MEQALFRISEALITCNTAAVLFGRATRTARALLRRRLIAFDKEKGRFVLTKRGQEEIALPALFGYVPKKRSHKNGEPRSCAFCGVAFRPQVSKLSRGPRCGTTCSTRCRDRHCERLHSEAWQARLIADVAKDEGLSAPALGARVGLSGGRAVVYLRILELAGRVKSRDRSRVFGYPARGKGWWLS